MVIVFVVRFVNKNLGGPGASGSGRARYVVGSGVDDRVIRDASLDLVGHDAHADRQGGEQGRRDVASVEADRSTVGGAVEERVEVEVVDEHEGAGARHDGEHQQHACHNQQQRATQQISVAPRGGAVSGGCNVGGVGAQQVLEDHFPLCPSDLTLTNNDYIIA